MKALGCWVSMMALAAWSLSAWAQERSESTGDTNVVPVAIARSANVDEAILPLVIQNLDRHLLQAPIRLPVLQQSDVSTLMEQAGIAASARPEQASCILYLVSHTNDLKTFGAVVPDRRAGAINVAALAEDAGGDTELIAKRVSKEAVNAGLLLHGLKPCPHPYCALSLSATTDGVDRKGFGACPPCLYQYVRHAEEMGVRVRPIGQ